MSKFVNYKKRDITLPGKCKDLIEVLQPHGASKPSSKIPGDVPGAEPAPVTRSETFQGRLSELEKYVTMVSESAVGAFLLGVTPNDQQFTVAVHRINDAVSASVTIRSESEQELAVRAFFAQRGLCIPEASGMPSAFVPGIPVQAIYQIEPHPSEPSLLTQLLSDLFSTAFGLNHDSPLSFGCCEISDPAP